MLLHDFGGDGEAQAGAAMLGGVEGQKQPLANFVGQAVAGVGDGDFNGRAVFAERGVRRRARAAGCPAWLRRRYR